MDIDEIKFKLSRLEKEICNKFPNAEIRFGAEFFKRFAWEHVHIGSNDEFDSIVLFCRELTNRFRDEYYRIWFIPHPSASLDSMADDSEYYRKRREAYLLGKNTDKAREMLARLKLQNLA